MSDEKVVVEIKQQGCLSRLFWFGFKSMILLVILLVVVVLAAPMVVPASWYRGAVSRALEDEFGRGVNFRTVKFSYWEGLTIRQFALDNAPGFSDQPCLTFDRVTLDVNLLDLIARELNVNAFEVESPTVLIERDTEGRLNFDDVGGEPGTVVVIVESPSPAPVPKPEPAPETAPAPAPTRAPRASRKLPIHFSVDRIAVTSGTVVYIDAQTESVVTLTDFTFDGKLLSPEEPLVFTSTSKLSGRGTTGDVAADGELFLFGPAPSGRQNRIKLTLDPTPAGEQLASAFSYLMPLLFVGDDGRSEFNATGTVEVRMDDLNSDDLLAGIQGEGAMFLTDGYIEGSPILKALAAGLQRPGLAAFRFEGLHQAFRVEGGRIHNQAPDFTGSEAAFAMSGWTSLSDMRIQQNLYLGEGLGGGEDWIKVARIINESGGIPIGGTITDPELNFDFGRLLQGLIQNVLKEQLEEQLGDKLDEQLGEGAAGEILDMFGKIIGGEQAPPTDEDGGDGTSQEPEEINPLDILEKLLPREQPDDGEGAEEKKKPINPFDFFPK